MKLEKNLFEKIKNNQNDLAAIIAMKCCLHHEKERIVKSNSN